MSWTKVFVVNTLLLALGLASVEAAGRAWLTFRNCEQGLCGTELFEKLQINKIDRSSSVGLSKLDPVLGYLPKEDFSQNIALPSWNNAKLTIDAQGFRANDNQEDLADGEKILALGDSFTFGDQVNNNETWPSCLERKLKTRVVNGGVFGYGAAQALLRGMKITEQDKYQTVILSILVGNDFERDRLMYRGGFAVPAVLDLGGKLLWAEPPNPYLIGTKYNPRKSLVLDWLFEHSVIALELAKRDGLELSGSRLDMLHPRAAQKDDIIHFTLAKFAAMDVTRKIVLLQYNTAIKSDITKKERTLIYEELAKLNLEFVDTYDALIDKDPAKYWQSHHTALGNELVCETLLEGLQKP
jgi:lysophospholipase L1-like esterase